ncbi:HNH endonuclease [Aestuariivivens marinum]|uniref:HNH endonuclease n=1 Tax=Aestuariivivens marinum TaxID=2913555 RepID=UPI001F585FFA|nr:HNH endonuclease signature motif containing protein [Aestuariivivens marinum]
MTVREILPIRRTVTTKQPTGKNWSEHKPDLREDFNCSCGYCDSYDGFRHTYFEVDHFIPKSLFEKNGNIEYCQYDNLTYSCKFCNNKKGSLWPSKDETIPNINEEGFVDACSTEYEDHLYRTSSGSIMWKTPLGKWMATKAFRFDERERSIIVLWNLNELRKIINALIIEQENYQAGDESYQMIKEKLGDYSLKYFIYHQELMDYYNE